jgi:hypothetical protein
VRASIYVETGAPQKQSCLVAVESSLQQGSYPHSDEVFLGDLYVGKLAIWVIGAQWLTLDLQGKSCPSGIKQSLCDPFESVIGMTGGQRISSLLDKASKPMVGEQTMAPARHPCR